MTQSITVLMGMPCSGKSTWVAENADPGAVIVSSNGLRKNPKAARAIFGMMAREAGVALYKGKSVIVDACSLRPIDREPWLAMAEAHGVQAYLVVIDTPAWVCRRRDDALGKLTTGRMSQYAYWYSQARLDIEREPWDMVMVIDHVEHLTAPAPST